MCKLVEDYAKEYAKLYGEQEREIGKEIGEEIGKEIGEKNGKIFTIKEQLKKKLGSLTPDIIVKIERVLLKE